MADDMPDFLMEFAERPAKTALGYLKDYRCFFGSVFGEFSGAHLETFLALDASAARKRVMAFYLKSRDKSPATLCRISSALRTLVGVARLHGATQLSSTDIPRPSRKAESYRDTSGVSVDQLQKMVAAAKCPRDKALVTLLGGLGLRRMEVAALTVGDYARNAEGGYLQVKSKGLGGQKETILAPEPLCLLIDAHLAGRGETKPSDPLFLGRHTEGISEIGINYIVSTLSRLAGISKEVSPHKLRHSAATIALDGGASLDQVQALMRHKSVSTTRRYDDNKQRYDGVVATSNVAAMLS